MPTHSKAIREYQIRHAVAEALGFVAVTLYVGVVTGIVYQLALLTGIV